MNVEATLAAILPFATLALIASLAMAKEVSIKQRQQQNASPRQVQ